MLRTRSDCRYLSSQPRNTSTALLTWVPPVIESVLPDSSSYSMT